MRAPQAEVPRPATILSTREKVNDIRVTVRLSRQFTARIVLRIHSKKNLPQDAVLEFIRNKFFGADGILREPNMMTLPSCVMALTVPDMGYRQTVLVFVRRGATRGKLVRAKWLDDWGKNGMRSRMVAEQFNWAQHADVTQNTPHLVAARLLVSKASSFGHKVGPEARCLAVWGCSAAFHHAPLDEDIVGV